MTAEETLTVPGEVLILREWICVLKRRDALKLPVGTRVLVKRDDGTLLETATRATPRDLGGQPCVDVEGMSGPYCLHRCYCQAILDARPKAPHS